MKRLELRHALLFIVAVFGLVLLVYSFVQPPRVASEDFDAFYCAARGLPADPYRYEPLHSCEAGNLHPGTPNAVVPAPLPPYALAAFRPLTRIAYLQAAFAWSVVLVASTLAIIWAIVELTSLSLLLVGVCVTASVLLQCLQSGALAPLPIAALSLSAVALVRGRHTVAALLLAVSCIEPHMALPPLLAVLLFVPAMRVRLAVVAAGLLAISLAVGPRLNIEYFLSVLPAHAASELGTEGQYGLSALLHMAGLSDRASVEAGSVQYALLAIAGLWLARSLHRAVPGSIVLAPMACAVTGGAFVHLTQIAGAVPFAFAVAAQMPDAVAWIGVTLVAIPWQSILGKPTAPIGGLILFAILLYRRVPWLAAAPASIALAAGIWALHGVGPPGATVHAIGAVRPTALSEVAWREFADQFPPTILSWVGHALTYLGLACVYWAAIMLARVARAPSQRVVARA
jgi:Glycosyltransferase family 87